MAKSNDAFRTIGEVSDDLGVPKHVLRFWEGKFPQLKPMKRGGGRRFYRPEDVVLLRGIKQLLHAAGYTIKGVQRILREDGVEAVKTLAAGGATAPARKAVQPPPATPAKAASRRGPPVPLPPAVHAALADLAAELNACLALAHGKPLPAPSKPVAKAKRASQL